MKARVSRFLGSAKGMILTVGALAGAVGAVLALVPKHSPVPPTPVRATFSDVSVYPNTNLDEFATRYQTRSLARDSGGPDAPVTLAADYRLLADTAIAGSRESSSTTPSETTTSSESSSTSDSTSSSETSTTTSTTTDTTSTRSKGSSTTSTTTTTTSTKTASNHTGPSKHPSKKAGGRPTRSAPVFLPPPPSHTPFHKIRGTQIKEGTGASKKVVKKVLALLRSPTTEVLIPARETGAGPSSRVTAADESPPSGPTPETRAQIVLPKSCDSACGATALLDKELLQDPDPVAAARRLAEAFAESRGKLSAHHFYPYGVTVNYTVDLMGFAHHLAIIEWSLWSKKTGRPLPKSWQREIIATQVKPKESDESLVGQAWIPTPRPPGDYVIRLTVYDSSGVARGAIDTAPPFH